MKISFANTIANDMKKTMESESFKSLFDGSFKFAEEDVNLASTPSADVSNVEDKDKDEEKCDESMADDTEVNSADDEDKENDMSCALDAALASLLNASGALDSVGFAKSAGVVLEVASFVVQAKKKAKDKKDKKDLKNPKKDSKSKKVDKKDEKKKDSKKVDKKDSKKK
jgi:hypothetical protein